MSLDEWIDETRDTAAKLSQHVDPKQIDKLLEIYMISGHEEKKRLRNDVESILGAHMPKLIQSQRTVMPTPTDLEGELEIGTIVQGDVNVGKFKVELADCCRHIAIFAQTGHGKSVLLYNIKSKMIQHKIGFWEFDVKGDGRGLINKHENLIVIPWRMMKWNPLRPPPHMEIKQWWQLFSEICGHAWGVYHAGVNYLLEYLDELYVEYKKSGHLPTLYDLYKLMITRHEVSRKRTEYFDVMWNRVHALNSIFGDNFKVETGIKLETLLGKPACFELDQMRVDEQSWMIEVMLTWLYAYNLTEKNRGEKLRHVVICDEAHRIWDANKEWRDTTREMGMPPINLFHTQYRDFGIGLILTSQEPSKVTQSVHANTLVKIVGNLGSGTDINAISESMGLEDEERKAIYKLKRGEWIVRMSDHHTEPFMIVTEDFHADKDVSDEAVEKRLLQMLPELKEPEEMKQLEPNQLLPFLSDDAKALILDVNRHPFRGISRRQILLGISGRRLELAKNELMKNSLVHEANVILGKSRPTKFLVPTDSGLQFLRTMGENADTWQFLGRMSFEHKLLQWLSAWAMKEAGYEVFREWDIGDGRRLDVCASRDGRRIGVEVQLNANLDSRKLLASLAKVDEIAIITNGNRVREDLDFQVNKILYPEIRPRVRIELARDFLERWKKVRHIDSGTNGNKEKES